jgi:hypothetical protein
VNHVPHPVAKITVWRNTCSSARTANCILCPNYPEEQVALIPPNPKFAELTLGNLKNIGGPAAVRLAKEQGLKPLEDSPDTELARARNLNMILRHIGVSCARVYLLLGPEPTDAKTLFLGPVPGHSVAEWPPPHVSCNSKNSLITLVDVALYVLLAYLILSVCVDVVL